MLPYYLEIEWYDYFIFGFYNLILSYLLFQIADIRFSISKKASWCFIGLFQILFLLVIANTFSNFLPQLHQAQHFSFMVQTGQYPESSQQNILPFYYLSLFLGLICLNSPIIFMIFNQFVLIIGLFMVLNGQKYILGIKKDPKLELTFAKFCLFIPSIYLYFTASLNTGFIIIAFAAFYNGFLKLNSENKWKQFVLSGSVLGLLKVDYLYFILPLFAFLWILHLNQKIIFKVFAMIVLFTFALLTNRYFFIQEAVTPALLSNFRNGQVEATGQFGFGIVNWHSYAQVVIDSFFILLQYLFNPFPIFVTLGLSDLPLLIADTLYLFGLLIILFVFYKSLLIKHKMVLLFLAFILLVESLRCYNLMDAGADRLPLVLIITAIVSSLVAKQKIKMN